MSPLTGVTASNIESHVVHGYAVNDDVKIHYASLGSGPLMIMIHGFPDFWYTWRHQMVALAEHYQTVAIDLRGYNLSDQPEGGRHYIMPKLVGDVEAVIRHLEQEQAIIVGHDWGGGIAWQFAMHRPAMTQRLIVLNAPNPYGMMHELVHNLQQQENSQYARNFQQEGAHLHLTAERLSSWVTDPSDKERYLEALQRSNFEAMLHYYKQNYPRAPYTELDVPVIKVQAPVLLIHGLGDQFLLPSMLNNTWEWLEQDLTLVTIPKAGHFVQQDAADLVTRSMKSWLAR